VDELVAVLADMIHSALVYEEKHGIQQYCPRNISAKPLTIIDSKGKVESPENVNKENIDEHQNSIRENEPN